MDQRVSVVGSSGSWLSSWLGISTVLRQLRRRLARLLLTFVVVPKASVELLPTRAHEVDVTLR